jgi:polyketide cyclase/dehydrase/lipid transport protein
MITLEKALVINASPEKAFARLGNPMNWLEDNSSIVDVTDITGEGVGRSYKMVYKMVGIKLPLTCTYTEYIENERVASKFEGGITGTFSLHLEPHNGSTKLSIVIEYTIPIPLIGKIAESLLAKRNDREWDVALANAKDAIEADSE